MSSLHRKTGLVSIGDVVYLPIIRISQHQYIRLVTQFNSAPWFEKIARQHGLKCPLTSGRLGWIALEVLKNELDFRTPIFPRKKYSEPEWMNRLPGFARTYIRREYAISGGIDALGIIPHFPHMGFGYIVRDDGLASDAYQTFHLHRLHDVRQLAFLHDPVIRENDRSAGTMMFDHTRFCHVMDVYAVANLISENCRLGPQDSTTLAVAAISHDALTPAGGDTTKLVDPERFDEDANYHRLLVGQPWEKFQEKYRIDRTLLIDTVLGKGLLGKILDLADKSSYLARDVVAYLGTAGPIKQKSFSPAYFMIATLVEQNRNICKLWDIVRVVGDDLVITQPDRLAAFLRLRALMFSQLYYNPYSRFFEYLIGCAVIKHLYRTGVLTYQDLMTYGYEWLERKIDEFFETDHVMRRFHNVEHSRIEEHPDYAAACRRAAKFDRDENVIAIVDTFGYPSNNATKRFKVMSRGRVMTFDQACPEAAEDIENLMRFPRLVRVYFFKCCDLDISPSARQRIKEVVTALR